MSFMARFFPKEPNFFQVFSKLSQKSIEGAKRLEKLMTDTTNTTLVKEIETLEDEADHIVHEGLVKLHDTFITPLDRINIYQLLLKLDEVIDTIHAAAQRIHLMKITNINDEGKKLASTLVEISVKVQELVMSLESLKQPEEIQKICIEINNLENKADDQLRKGLTHLLENENDFKNFFKHKELLEVVEKATDSAEDITHLVEAIILDHA